MTIDADGTICEVVGKTKHGAAYGYTGKLGYHPLVAAVSETAEIVHARMRGGSSRKGHAHFIVEAVNRTRRAGATGPVTVRADSEFWSYRLVEELDDMGVEWSITLSQYPHVREAIANTPAGHGQLIDWAHTTNAARVAIEGSGTYGRPAAVAAMAAGLDVREVPPQLTARLRRRGRTQTKTDQVDALVVARVALRDHTLAGPTFWKDTEDLRLLVSYRRELVEHRTAQANRLHADLGKLRPGYHHNIPRLTTRKSLDQAMKLLWRDTTPHARIAKQRIRTLRQLDHPNQRTHHRNRRNWSPKPELAYSTFTAFGVLVAATVLSEVGNPTRYSTKAKFAMANGTAPIEASSGRVVRHRLNRGGNRQLKPGHPHRRTHPDRPHRHRRTPLLPKAHNPRKRTHREALRVLKRRNLRPHLGPTSNPRKPAPI